MSRLPKVVVAGYGCWALAEKNPAALIAEGLTDAQIDGCEIFALTLPVSSADLTENITRILNSERPDIWVGVGVDTTGSVIKPEMVGINWRHFSVPDVDGALLDGRPVFEDGPAAYNSGFPNKKIVSALRESGIPAQLSFFAGTHLCNQMLYSVNHLSRTMGLSTSCGFIHVPQTPENIVLSTKETQVAGSMSLSMSSRAIRRSIEVIRDDFHCPTRQAA